MTLSATTYWELDGTATANSVNGGGFNIGNVNMMTDLATDANTANTASPVVSSATYSFVAGDVGAYVFVKSGSNWQGNAWFKIVSVSGGKATLNGTANQWDFVSGTTNEIIAGTTTGVSVSSGTVTGGTFSIDYSRLTTAPIGGSDLASTNGTTNPSTVTSAGTPFGRNHVGNILHVTAGTNWTAGWYEIVSVSGTTATLDRAVGGAVSLSSGTFKCGGAVSLNSTLDDAFFESLVGGNFCYFGNNLTIGSAVNLSTTSPTSASPATIKGYQTYRYNIPTGSNRPTITCGANNLQMGQYKILRDFIVTGTSTPAISTTTGGIMMNIKVLQQSTTAARIAITNTTNGLVYNCEAVSQNGTAINLGTSSYTIGNYVHDSNIGITSTTAYNVILFNIVEACRSKALEQAGTATQCEVVIGNTFYGREAQMGTGYDIANASTSSNNTILNNIFYGLTTGIAVGTSTKFTNLCDYNTFYNNGADVSRVAKGPNNITLNPNFSNVSQITGTTATTSGSVLTQSGGNFASVVDNVSYLHVLSGTGVTTGGYLITSHTATTLTVNNALGTSSGGDVTYFVTLGHNFAVGTNMQAAGFPGTFQAGFTTGYMDIGAAQRQLIAAYSFCFGG